MVFVSGESAINTDQSAHVLLQLMVRATDPKVRLGVITWVSRGSILVLGVVWARPNSNKRLMLTNKDNNERITI